MMTTLAALVALACVACGPTKINLAARPALTARAAPDADCEAQVIDYPSALELPEGSRHVGSVTVRSLEGEAAFRELRRRVWALGGDAVTQAVWVKEPGEAKPRLVANAWESP
jgi:hypothetical protein